MPESFEELWESLRSLPWLRELPEWLREPVLFMAGGALLFALIYLILRLLTRPDRAGRDLRREIRDLRRDGDFLEVGQRYETLGRYRAALKAYRRGGLHADYAELLLRRGKRKAAKRAAREGEVWVLYGNLCREDGELEEAGAAFEQAGKLYEAARAWEAAGQRLKAARCYAAAGMEDNAFRLLRQGDGRTTAEALEAAIRKSLTSSPRTLKTADAAAHRERTRAVRRCVQLWLGEGEAQRAYRLAVDSGQWQVAVPLARDYLEPDPARAEFCVRAGDYLAAAEIYKRLGDADKEALCRGEHFLSRGDAAQAARSFEAARAWSRAAEQWTVAGDLRRAAMLHARAEEYAEAAQLYAEAGDESDRQSMLEAARAHDPRAQLETREPTPAERPHAALPAGGSPGDQQRYVLEREIGRGGMGMVYRARDVMLERLVACKVLSSEVAGAVGDPAALLEEARAAARLSHPNIVQVYDVGQTSDGFFVVMELIDGENFAALLKKRKLSIAGVAVVGRQICAALEHAHKRGIVHRDLKPSNLMWTSEDQVKLTDFGLARAFESSVGQVQTRAAGTPFYMAPEQIRGEPVGVETDVYALGCVLFELACNRAPFASDASSIYHHLNSRPEDPRDLRREVPAPLAEVILRCLEKDPQKRPRSAAEVAAVLAALAPG